MIKPNAKPTRVSYKRIEYNPDVVSDWSYMDSGLDELLILQSYTRLVAAQIFGFVLFTCLMFICWWA